MSDRRLIEYCGNVYEDCTKKYLDSVLKVEDSNIFIGILWKKFGTPGKDGKTGTEHEFNNAYEAWKKTKDLKSCCISTKSNILLQRQKKHNNLQLF